MAIATATPKLTAPARPARRDGYNWLARLLHWISALIIVWATVTGIYASALPESSPIRGWIGYFNVSLTTLFVPIFVLRVVNRIASPSPGPVGDSRVEHALAQAAHLTLYAVITVVMVTGVATVSHEASVFGLFTLPPVPMSESARHLWEAAHKYACYLLAGLVVLHVAAVVFHMRRGRNILARMAP